MDKKKRRKPPSIQQKAEEEKEQQKEKEKEEKRKKLEDDDKVIHEQPAELEQSPVKERDTISSKKSLKKKQLSINDDDDKSTHSVARSVRERKKSNISKPIITEKKSSSSLPVIQTKKSFPTEESKEPDKKSVGSKKTRVTKSNISKTSLPVIESLENQETEENKLPEFQEVISGEPDNERLVLPPIVYNRSNYPPSVPSTPSVKSKHSSKKTATPAKPANPINNDNLPMFDEIMNGDPDDKRLILPALSFTQRYQPTPQLSRKNTPTPSIKSKKSEHSPPVVEYGAVEPSRVIFEKENQKEQLDNLLCSLCRQYPLDPERCSECKKIYCKNCNKLFTKCPNCNSIYKPESLPEETNTIFIHAHIICKYKECGCDKELLYNELRKHEAMCKNIPITCKDCNKRFIYDTILQHYEVCPKRNLKKCPVCDFEVREEEYDRTEKKIMHIKHTIMPEVKEMIQNELKIVTDDIKGLIEKNTATILEKMVTYNDHELKEQEKVNHDETLKNIILLQNMIKQLQDTQNEMQAAANKKMEDELENKKHKRPTVLLNDTLDKKLKTIQLIKEISKNIDNGYECDNKFCVLTTFKQDYLVVYPNLRYGIDEYNLSSGILTTKVKNAHDSNIICMSYVQNPNDNLTYLSTASFDRSIKVFTIENEWKNVKTITNAHDDYSIFGIDMMYNKEKGVAIISGNHTNMEFKVWYIGDGQEANNTTIKTKGKVCCIHHNTFVKEENPFFYVGTTEGVYQYNIKEKQEEPSKVFVEEGSNKAKHTRICFLETDEDTFIEGDSFGKVRVWSISKVGIIKIIERGILKYQINSLSPWNENVVIGGTRDGKVLLFNIEEGVAVDSVGFHNGYVYCVKVADHWKYEKIIVSCGFDGIIKEWGTM